MDHRDAEALSECEKALEIHPHFVPALKVKRWIYTVRGDRSNAIDALHQEIEASGGSLDGAGPVIAGGLVFVNSGYPRFGGTPGNVLLAFGVRR